jgi:hypothetical protein
MPRNAETLLATALSVKKGSAQRRPRRPVNMALAETLMRGQPSPNLDDVLQTIEQIVTQAVRWSSRKIYDG